MVTNALVFFVKDHVIILGAVRFLFGERNIAVKFISSCPTSFYELNSSYKCNGIHINNLFKFFVWCEVSKSFTRSII